MRKHLATVSVASVPKIQIFNDGSATQFNTAIKLLQGQTGFPYSYQTLTTVNSPFIPTINFLYQSLITNVVQSATQTPLTYTLAVTPSILYNYSTTFYNTTVCNSAVANFTLSTNGRATFSFCAQPPNNNFNSNNAYCQLTTPSWIYNGQTQDMSAIFNGNYSGFLLGAWNSNTLLGKSSFPFMNTTANGLNRYAQTMYSTVLYYPNATSYTQSLTAQICSFTDSLGNQNLFLIVYPSTNGLALQSAFQISNFTICFGG